MTHAFPFFALLAAVTTPPDIERLGHKSFRVREAAHRSLEARSIFLIPVLEKHATTHPVAEVRRRCEILLAPYAEHIAWRDSADIFPSRGTKKHPWLSIIHEHGWRGYGDAIPYIDRCRVMGVLPSKTGAPDWTEYRVACRLWVAGRLLERWSRAEIVRELDYMLETEELTIRELQPR